MAFTILHFSDLHLDTSFAGAHLPPAVARRCRAQLLATLDRIIDFARARQVNAVTIAGNLLAREHLLPETALRLYRAFESLAPIPVCIAPGLQDAADPASPYRRGRWPENVNIALKTALTEWPLSREFSLWTAAHLSPHDRHDFLAGFRLPAAAPGARPFPILLLHANAVAASAARNTSSLTSEEIRAAGFTLALLGQEQNSRIAQEGNLLMVHPGSPEPLGFDSAGQHGVTLVELAPGKAPNLEQIPLAALRFETVEVAVESFADRGQLCVDLVARAQAHKWQDHFVRLRLTGRPQPTLRLDVDDLTARLEEHFGHLRLENQTRPGQGMEQIAAEPTVRGEFVREMLARLARDPEQQELYIEALGYGVQAFEQDEITLR